MPHWECIFEKYCVQERAGNAANGQILSFVNMNESSVVISISKDIWFIIYMYIFIYYFNTNLFA